MKDSVRPGFADESGRPEGRATVEPVAATRYRRPVPRASAVSTSVASSVG
jgi:hypothetical protein